MTHDQELTGYILEGMARAIWVHAFMIWASEVDPPPVLRGDTWDEAAGGNKSTRSASMQAAQALNQLIEHANPGVRHPLIVMFREQKQPSDGDGTQADRAYWFGRELALACIGARAPMDMVLRLPSFEVSLDDDGRALSWDGGMSWHSNPPRRKAPATPAAPPARDVPLSEGDARKLRAIREHAYEIMSDEAARRLVERIDRALATGVVDSQTQGTLESYGDVEEWRSPSVTESEMIEMMPWKQNPPWPSSQVQSLLFSRHRYSEGQAKRWAQDHGFKYGSVDTTENYRRLRQFEPKYGQPCRTIELGHGIHAIVCAVSNPAGRPLGIEVLVVEDDPKIQTGIARMVKSFLTNPHVIFADNIGAAIADLEVHQFGLVISDVNVLGPRTGIDLFRHVEEQYPGLVDRFVFFTDSAEARRIHYRYIEKGGATAEDLKRAVRAAAPAQRPASITMRPVTARMATIPLADLAHEVNSSLPTIHQQEGPSGYPMGRFGDKVFIAAVWRAVKMLPGISSMTLPEFKRKLVEANQQSLVDLARLDSQGDVDPEELIESEITDRGSTFHVVVDRSRTRAPAPRAVSLQEFAAAVNEIASTIRTEPGHDGMPKGRFSRNKVFIAAIWRAAQGNPLFAAMTRAEFNQQLLTANKKGLLVLARADLVGAMDAAEVADSEIHDRGADFHFVLDQSAKDPWER